MKSKGRIIEGDERTLILLYHLLDQGMPAADAFVFLCLKDKDEFIKRNGLMNRLDDRETLMTSVSRRIEELAETADGLK